MDRRKVLIIGLGEIGHSNADYMSKKGLAVDGFDINNSAISRAIANGVIRASTTNFAGYQYYIVCISTHQPRDMSEPYLDGMFEIANKLAAEGEEGALVGIDSTVTRGTSSKILNLLHHKMHVVHVPHRFYIHEKQEHGVNQPRVLGGCDACCTEKGREFYNRILGIPLHIVNSVEVAELCKIVENSYRFIEIAFAEELKMFCDRSDINFKDLRAAINTKWNIKILEAKDGIGGHCLPKDSQMFLNLTKDILDTSIIEAAKKVDEKFRIHVARPTEEIQQVIR